MLDGRLTISGLMLVIFASAVAIAFFEFAPSARMLPLVIGIPGLILSAMQLGSELRRSRVSASPHEAVQPMPTRTRTDELLSFGWFAVFALGIVGFGFVYASPVLIAAHMRMAGRESWYTAGISAALVWVVLRYGFEQFIGIVLFEGLIPPMFPG